MHQNPELLPVGPLDLVLAVPPFPGANFMDFDRHFEVFEAAYQWCRGKIDELAEQGRPGARRDPGHQGLIDRETSRDGRCDPVQEKPRRSGAK